MDSTTGSYLTPSGVAVEKLTHWNAFSSASMPSPVFLFQFG
jgi:hypothetical protein